MILQIEKGFLAYDLIGQGLPLLFIHGYPLNRKIWQPQLSDLSDITRLISIDLRGHGESFPFEPPYSMELLAEDCMWILEMLKVKTPIIVCGLSMGGYIAFALYRKYPEIFKALILTSTRAGSDSPEGKVNRDRAVQNVRDHGVAMIVESMLPKLVSPTTLSSKPGLVKSIKEIMLETSVQGVVGASLGMRDRLDSTELLSQITCPTLIIQGADDQLIPVQESQVMEKYIPSSHLLIIPGAGHLPNMEQPDRYNQAIRHFINSLA
jgi:3-oxoadipate enol-lactonase